MPLFQIAATGSKSIGPEGPPTKASACTQEDRAATPASPQPVNGLG
ncbi:DUF6053 domain-containing protein [Lysobacter enzymogenes]